MGVEGFRNLGVQGKQQRIPKSGEKLQEADQQRGPVGRLNRSGQQGDPAGPKYFPL